MPISATVEDTGRVYIRASGLVTYDDLRNFVRETGARPSSGSPQLFDARGAQTEEWLASLDPARNKLR